MNVLQTKKEELKKQGKKGFTLMELLIVVAIIAVLVAIAIPLFTNQLEKAREATDLANIRAAYAECSAAQLTGEGDTSEDVTITQREDGWKTSDLKIGGKSVDDLTWQPTDQTGDTTVTVSVDASGNFDVKAKA